MVVRMVDCENAILAELTDHACTKDGVAQSYAWCMISGEKIDWAKVNGAIRTRWDQSTLASIKGKAWKLVRKKRNGG